MEESNSLAISEEEGDQIRSESLDLAQVVEVHRLATVGSASWITN